MKNPPILNLTAVLLLFFGCSKSETNEILAGEKATPAEETPPEENPADTQNIYFTYNANQGDTSETDDWLIIHHKDGELIDYRAFEGSDQLLFKDEDSILEGKDTLAITHFSVWTDGNITSHTLYSYTDIPKGFVWNQEIDGNAGFNIEQPVPAQSKTGPRAPETSGGKEGVHSITVTSVPGIAKYNITCLPRGVISADYNIHEETTLKIDEVSLTDEVQNFFFIGDLEGGMKYLFFETGEDTVDLVFDYADFSEYDGFITTELAPNDYLFSVMRGHEASQWGDRGYEISVELDFSGPSQSEIAYIDRFESYSTYFQVHFLSGYSYRYSARREEPIEPLAIPEKPAFTVTETSPHAFRFDTDIEYKRTGSTWRYSENFQDGSYISSTWTIHTTKRKSITAGRLPEPLLQAYPSFDPDKMVHANTYLTIQGNTYDAIRSALASPSTSDFPLVQETIILDSPEN